MEMKSPATPSSTTTEATANVPITEQRDRDDGGLRPRLYHEEDGPDDEPEDDQPSDRRVRRRAVRQVAHADQQGHDRGYEEADAHRVEARHARFAVSSGM